MNYTTNNYIYERTAGGAVRTGGAGGTGGAGVAVVAPETGNTSTETMEGTVSRSTDEKLLKALDNLKNNTTTRERQQSTSSTGSIGSNGSSGSRIKNRISSNNHPHPLNRTGSDLQQVYELKKPLCMPAVLRPGLGSNPPNLTPTTSRPETPNDISTTVDITSPTFTRSNGSMDSTGTSPTTPYVDIKAYPFPVGDNTNITITAGSSPEDSLSSMRIDRNQAAEPSHEHWRPNNYTTNCMKCFDTFGNFFTPQRKRRHHCRFCGSIFCFDCLWQIESDNFSTGGNVGHGIANRRLSRSTLNGSIQPTNGIVPSATATGGPGIGSVGGILLDSQAKFVVPIFSEIQKNGLSTQFDEYFKFCKVCKDCGNQYQSLVTELNSNEAAKTSPFLFIENPYLQQRKYGLVSSENNFENRQRLIERGRQMSGIKESDLPNAKEFKSSNDPKLQLNNVPSDWSWSSF